MEAALAGGAACGALRNEAAPYVHEELVVERVTRSKGRQFCFG
tara:strand:+ start:492 stop:620 length:129 start_codon:yes stop_codon:yes gene_type:complete